MNDDNNEYQIKRSPLDWVTRKKQRDRLVVGKFIRVIFLNGWHVYLNYLDVECLCNTGIRTRVSSTLAKRVEGRWAAGRRDLTFGSWS